jgi:thiol:disulfide interchange protein DsbA
MSKNKKANNGLKNKPVSSNKSLAKNKNKMSNSKKVMIGAVLLAFGFSTISFMNTTTNNSIAQAPIEDRAPVVFDSYVEGEHFFILSEKINDIEMDDSKLNVTKFFWYGCPHCASLEPFTSSWSSNNKEDVNMNYVHPALGDGWSAHARIYYALEASNLVKYHESVMRGAKENSARFTDPDVVASLMNSSESEEFLNAYNSSNINEMISDANSLSRKVGITGVPTILVENQIITSPGFFSSNRDLIRMLESFKNNKENLRTAISEVTTKIKD